MSAAAQTKIFGVRVNVDPKLLVGILIALAVILFWYNSRGDDEPSAPATAAAARPEATTAPVAALPARTRLSALRRAAAPRDSGTLRLRAVDATRGDVDPTLRLDLLARLASVQPAVGTRSLFEAGPAVQTASNSPPIKGPIIPVNQRGPSAPTATPPAPPVVNIPLKYYGFAKPLGRGESNRGFFMDGDNVLVASEGDLVQRRYLVVELTPSTARMEDVQLKQGQTLQVVPEATAQ
ncbi:MAG: hypothetical protein WB992_21820 [Bryobacteraceae bacterium]